MEHNDHTSVANIFTEAMKALAMVAEHRPPRERAEIRRAIATLRTNQPHAQRLLAAAPIDDDQPRLASGIVEPESSEASVLRDWGADLEQRRKAAGMTRDVLAERAGISESTLRNVEKGKRPPTRTTLMHLQSVPELRIDPSPVAGLVAGKAARARSFTPNCWLAPEFDAIKLHAEMTMQLSGRGGHIEQTYLYLEPSSATAWCAIAEQESYTSVRTAMPLSRVVERVSEMIGGAGMDVLGLGCGDGKDEIRLTQCLLEQHPGRNLRLYLLDISQPLCSLAYRHAAQVLGGHASVEVFALQGSFYNLQRYQQLLHTPQRAHRRRLLCMFGNTFANLHNEVLFVRNSLLGFAPGDLLLLGVPAALAPADQRELILKNDRALNAGHLVIRTVSGGAGEQFFTGLLRRYVEGFKSVELREVLDFDACPVPGSYAGDIRATVKTVDGETKQFSVAYRKRYDQKQLDQKMASEGWEPVGHWRYAEEYHPRLLLLYRRTQQPAEAT